ncbi:MAG: hypothetical protein ACRD2J_08085 [Thermoanaerobaculia bacterium]
MKRWIGLALGTGMLVLGCQEAANEPAPVDLVATAVQDLQVIDINDPECGQAAAVTVRNIIKRPGVAPDERFLDVRLTSYRVTYRRTDGGTLVPRPFMRSLSLLVPATGQATDLGDFLLFEPGAVNQAPFAALRPANGGVDPETGRRNVTMEVILDFFGETLSGEEVSARARMEFTFCLGCGGCV